VSDKFVQRANNKRLFKQDSNHNHANGINVHVHVSYYYDTGEANDVVSGLGYRREKSTNVNGIIITF